MRSGACTRGSIARPRDATRTGSGCAATTSTGSAERASTPSHRVREGCRGWMRGIPRFLDARLQLRGGLVLAGDLGLLAEDQSEARRLTQHIDADAPLVQGAEIDV